MRPTSWYARCSLSRATSLARSRRSRLLKNALDRVGSTEAREEAVGSTHCAVAEVSAGFTLSRTRCVNGSLSWTRSTRTCAETRHSAENYLARFDDCSRRSAQAHVFVELFDVLRISLGAFPVPLISAVEAHAHVALQATVIAAT